MTTREIHVYADWNQLGTPTLMGTLMADQSRGKEIFSFTYDKTWLASGFALILDPDLQFYDGPQYLASNEKPNFGMFLDSSPDRWGRVLMRRREAAEARLTERRENKLFETDFLLGVLMVTVWGDSGSKPIMRDPS